MEREAAQAEVDLEQGLDEAVQADEAPWEAAEREDEEKQRQARTAEHLDADWKKRWVIQRDGKDYVLYAGLLDLLHLQSGGDFAITTRLEQAPSEANQQTAIVSATVAMGAEGRRVASGLGDASPQSVNRMMAPHLCRMAETRAKGRALRDLLNVGLVMSEELGPAGPAGGAGQGYSAGARSEGAWSSQQGQRQQGPPAAANGAPARPGPDAIMIQGRKYTRQQLWLAYGQRMEQAQDAGLDVGKWTGVTQQSRLSEIAGTTQAIRKALEAEGAL